MSVCLVVPVFRADDAVLALLQGLTASPGEDGPLVARQTEHAGPLRPGHGGQGGGGAPVVALLVVKELGGDSVQFCESQMPLCL